MEVKKNKTMALYNELKTKHPDAIVMFRTGDFYIMYKQDAVDVSQILHIDYSRTTDGDEIAGFPYYALDTYLPKVVRADRRVAICDTLDDEAAKRFKSIVSQRREETVCEAQ